MKKRFFAWKDANCDGKNPKWIEMSGKEFYAFKQLPGNYDRKFVALSDADGLTDTVFLETTKSEYDRWHSGEGRKRRKKRRMSKYKYLLLSLDTVVNESCGYTFNDVLPDDSADIEDEVITECLIEQLPEAISSLSGKEKKLIMDLFLGSEERLSVRQIAENQGIPPTTLHDRKVAVLKKIKKYLEHEN